MVPRSWTSSSAKESPSGMVRRSTARLENSAPDLENPIGAQLVSCAPRTVTRSSPVCVKHVCGEVLPRRCVCGEVLPRRCVARSSPDCVVRSSLPHRCVLRSSPMLEIPIDIVCASQIWTVAARERPCAMTDAKASSAMDVSTMGWRSRTCSASSEKSGTNNKRRGKRSHFPGGAQLWTSIGSLPRLSTM